MHNLAANPEFQRIQSYQQAAIYDPDHPMPYWGMAHAMGPNPNSRYARMPDDPRGEGLKRWARIVEVTHEKPAEIVWDMRLKDDNLGWAIYRGERLPPLYPEG